MITLFCGLKCKKKKGYKFKKITKIKPFRKALTEEIFEGGSENIKICSSSRP